MKKNIFIVILLLLVIGLGSFIFLTAGKETYYLYEDGKRVEPNVEFIISSNKYEFRGEGERFELIKDNFPLSGFYSPVKIDLENYYKIDDDFYIYEIDDTTFYIINDLSLEIVLTFHH